MKIGKVKLINAKAIFFCKDDSFNPLRFSLTRETDTKKLSNCENLLLSNDKINQNTNFAKLTSANDFSINVSFIVQELKFCKIPQLFIVSISLARENLRLLRELFMQKNPAINSR